MAGTMDNTIAAIDTIALRIPLDIWAPAPMSQGVPRTHVECLYVRVTTGSGLVGWGELFGTARPMVTAAFDHWIRRLAVGQSATDGTLVPRLERMLLSMSRAGPMLNALAGLDIALWDIRGKREGVPVSALLGGAKRRMSNATPRCCNITATPSTSRATPRARWSGATSTSSCMSARERRSRSPVRRRGRVFR